MGGEVVAGKCVGLVVGGMIGESGELMCYFRTQTCFFAGVLWFHLSHAHIPCLRYSSAVFAMLGLRATFFIIVCGTQRRRKKLCRVLSGSVGFVKGFKGKTGLFGRLGCFVV